MKVKYFLHAKATNKTENVVRIYTNYFRGKTVFIQIAENARNRSARGHLYLTRELAVRIMWRISKMYERNDLFSYNLLTPRGKGYYYGKENET